MEKSNNSFYLVSLGCPKNLVDTEVIAGTLLTANYAIAFDAEDADIYIINTCAFIPEARKEAFEAIQEAISWKKHNKNLFIVVAGCLSEYDQNNEFKEKFPQVDLWTTVNDIEKINLVIENKKLSDSSKPKYLYDHNSPRLQLTMPHVAYLKISDGCNNCCSYCAIPRLRGCLRSRSIDSIVQEAKNFISNGAKELVIIAQDITAFGDDRPESNENLTMLLKELNKLDGDFVIRLLYTHIAHYTDEFIEFFASKERGKVLPYLDVPLQHISERILKDMNRHTTAENIRKKLTFLKDNVEDLTLRTTFITGLPGETKEEFKELTDFVKEFKFQRCGVFPFSPEVGTVAYNMPEQVSNKTAKARAKKLMKIQEEIMLEHNQNAIGKKMDVIVDYIEGNYAIARGSADAPDIDNIIRITKGKKLNSGERVEVEITEAYNYELVGKIVTKKKEK